MPRWSSSQGATIAYGVPRLGGVSPSHSDPTLRGLVLQASRSWPWAESGSVSNRVGSAVGVHLLCAWLSYPEAVIVLGAPASGRGFGQWPPQTGRRPVAASGRYHAICRY